MLSKNMLNKFQSICVGVGMTLPYTHKHTDGTDGSVCFVIFVVNFVAFELLCQMKYDHKYERNRNKCLTYDLKWYARLRSLCGVWFICKGCDDGRLNVFFLSQHFHLKYILIHSTSQWICDKIFSNRLNYNSWQEHTR